MSSFSSIYASLSGLFGFSRALDNASDNVANINTPGYKGRDLTFKDLTNEQGEGVGVDVSGSSVRHQQGDINETGNLTDLAIDGEGFFILREGSDAVYSRSGQFQFDEEGYLVDPASGRRVAALDAGGRLLDIQIDRAAVSNAIETTIVSLIGNLNSQVAQGASYPGANDQPIEFEIFDSLGESHTLRITFTRAGDNDWDVQLSNGEDIPLGPSFTIGFDENTGLPLANENTILFTYQPFDLVDADDYPDHLTVAAVTTVVGGDLTTAGPIVLDPEAGFSFLIRTNPDEGVEVVQTTQFRFDGSGNLIDPSTGKNVQALSTTGELVDFSISDLLTNSGEATSNVFFQGNLDAGLTSGSPLGQSYNVDVLDADGNTRTLTVYLEKNQNNTWDVRLEDANGNVYNTNGSIVFDTAGNPTNAVTSFTFSPFAGFTALPISSILDTVADVDLTTDGDLTTAGQLSLGINTDGEDAGALFLLRSDTGEYSFVTDEDFSVDSDGYLVNSSGDRLLSMDAAGLVAEIDLNNYLTSSGQASSLLQFAGNFDPADTVGTLYPPSGGTPLVIDAINSDGTVYQWSLSYEKTAANEWQLRIANPAGELVTDPISITFDPSTGVITSGGLTAINYQPTNNLSATDINSTLQTPPPINVTGGDLTTGVQADLTIDQTNLSNGGYFLTRTGEIISTSTTSSFVFNAAGLLVEANTGQLVAGLVNPATGLFDPNVSANNQVIDNIDVTSNLSSPAVASSSIGVSGILDTSDTNPQTVVVTAFDANGGTHDLTLSITRVSLSGTTSSWDVQVFDENSVNIGNTSTAADIFFNNEVPTLSNITIQYDPLSTGTPTNLQFRFAGVTAPNTAQPFSLQQASNNGRTIGVVSQIIYTQNGTIQFNYDNGDQQNVAQLAIREFDGAALNLNVDLQITEDSAFGTDVRLSSNDGLAMGELDSFTVDSSGVLQFAYNNGASIVGPALAIVDQLADNSDIAIDFTGATSISGQPTDLNVLSVNGLPAGDIESLQFDDEGVLQISYENGETAEGPRIALVEERGSLIQDLTIDFGDSGTRDGVQSQATGTSSITVEDVDGRGAGSLTAVRFDEDGYLTADYANGEKEQLQRIGLARFDNIATLFPTSGSFFRAIDESGIEFGYANERSFGSIAPSSLELSNVDLTSEFGNIIIIQRGYQAASQALNATNEVIEELYNTLRGG